jgi:hypothetical protein
MARRIVFELSAASLFIASTVALTNAQQYDWGAYYGQRSALLRKGMTEQEVVQIVGYQPNKVELQTCGQETREGPWSCKQYTYGNLYQNLRVTFAEVRGRWVVNSWSVFP